MSVPIDECEELIWDALDSSDESSFEYIKDDSNEFLVLNTSDFFADPRALDKIKRTTGMRLVQFNTRKCYTHLWFMR
jgi:hypothetical protein